MLSPNTILQSRYRVIRQLGEGGMGTVYEAIDERVSCVVAVKETLVAKDGEARRAFEREAALLANLRHASLPKVMDHFTEDEGQFLVMEYVPGYDLAELLEMRGTSFPPSQVLQWADELLKVLEYLHGRKPPILHRDIKPSNLKLTRQGEIFLLDFGLAKGSAGQMPTLLTSRSVRGYTPVYASLEQIHGKGTDPRSDLYSLGATLYHLLTGEPPKDAPTRFDALEDDQQDPLPPIQEINPQVSPAIASVIHRAMAVSRKSRPANATEMRRALREAEEETHRAAAEQRERLEREQQQAEEAARLHAEAEAARQAAAEAEAARRLTAEVERRRQEEAETLRLQEAQRQAEEEAKRRQQEAEEERRRFEERSAAAKKAWETRRQSGEPEQSKPRDESVTEIPTEPASLSTPADAPATISASTQRAKDTDAPPATSGVKTLKEKPAQLYQSADALNTSPAGTMADEAKTETGKGSKRALLIAAAFALVFVVIVVVVLKMRGGGSALGEQAEQQASEGPAATVKQPNNSAAQPTPPAGMVYVPGGMFTMGRPDGDEYERPAHPVSVKPFFMDMFEVTNEEYAKFIKATNHRPPTTWANSTYSASDARKPVTGVTWDSANAYAVWADKRLPSEEEWEFAARGTDGRLYPWGGNKWRTGLANAGGASSGIADVGTYKGASPFGALDMIGNAWEWTASRMVPYSGGSLPVKITNDLKVIRGGTYLSNLKQATTTYRRGYRASGEADYGNTGFRCVKDITQR